MIPIFFTKISLFLFILDLIKFNENQVVFNPYFFVGLVCMLFLLLLFLAVYIYSLRNKKFHLESNLSKRARDMQLQKEELQTQIEFTTIQNHKIEKQNQELRKHRQNLEALVRQRTKDLEEAKKKAEESDRLKSAFLANMSHEIRTPMNAIIGFSNLLYEQNLSEDEQNELLNHINDNTEHLLKLIENLIDIAKIETNELEFHYKFIDLHHFLDEIYQEYIDCYHFGDKAQDLEIYKQVKEKNIYVYTDPWRLQQIIYNLIDNAIKFTDSGRITFGYRFKDYENCKMIEYFVEDTGVGIGLDQQKHIYEIFRKFYHNQEHYNGGTGIGLSICKKLVEGLDGKIWVESVPGKGSTFYFALPHYEKKLIFNGKPY